MSGSVEDRPWEHFIFNAVAETFWKPLWRERKGLES